MGYLEDLLKQQEEERKYTLEMVKKAREEGYKSLEDYFSSIGLLHSGTAVRQFGELEEKLMKPLEEMELRFSRERMALKEQIRRANAQKWGTLLTGLLSIGGTLLGTAIAPGIGSKLGYGLGGFLGESLSSLLFGTVPTNMAGYGAGLAEYFVGREFLKARENILKDLIKLEEGRLKLYEDIYNLQPQNTQNTGGGQ